VQPQPPTALSGINGGNHNTFLNWTASTATDVAGYKVYRGTSPGVYTTTISLNSPVTNYNDQGLATGTTYFYVVTAVSAAGVESVFSNEVQVTIP
jgi:fibronectin type 3 domain-containing protein